MVTAVRHERDISIKKAPPEGTKVKCPACGRKTAVRVLSSNIGFVIKGSAMFDWKPGEKVRTQVDGKEVSFEFVDHPETDPALQRNLARMAKQHGVEQGLGKARFDPKSGRVVVDVASNVPDPLGMMSRAQKEAKKRGEWEEKLTPINERFKRKGKFRSPIPIGAAMAKAQAKRAAKNK